MHILGNTLYIVHTDNNGTVATYDLTTGAFTGLMSSLAYNWVSPRHMTSDGTDFYFADSSRVIKTDANGLVLSWIGKVSNNNSMSGNPVARHLYLTPIRLAGVWVEQAKPGWTSNPLIA